MFTCCTERASEYANLIAHKGMRKPYLEMMREDAPGGYAVGGDGRARCMTLQDFGKCAAENLMCDFRRSFRGCFWGFG